jgi:hypothetical protein
MTVRDRYVRQWLLRIVGMARPCVKPDLDAKSHDGFAANTSHALDRANAGAFTNRADDLVLLVGAKYVSK